MLADYSIFSTLVDLQRSKDASSYNSSSASDTERRKLNILKSAFVMPPPLDDALATELSKIETKLSAMYGKCIHCFSENDCNDLEGFEAIIDNSRDPKELKKAWEGWHEIGKPMKGPYMRMVEIGNQGAQELGYDDLSDLWFSKYDMPSEEFLQSIDEVWNEVKPLWTHYIVMQEKCLMRNMEMKWLAKMAHYRFISLEICGANHGLISMTLFIKQSSKK